jgi:hypothetical protein
MFEAGSIQHFSMDARYIFDADRSFITGMFGTSNFKKDKIISLGFILSEKIKNE